MLIGTTCRLRAVTEQDLERLRLWRTSNDIRPYFTDKWLYSPIEQKSWFESMSADSRQRFLIAEDSAGAAYGIVNVQSINYQHGTATVGWYFVRENGRDLGRLTQHAAVLLLDYVFIELGIRKIYADILATNERALKFNSRLGFEVEGTQKAQVYHMGSYVDLVWQAVFKDKYLALRAGLLPPDKT